VRSCRILLFFFCAALAATPLACKSTGDAPQAQTLDFDTDADAEVAPLTRDYKFCPRSTSFNIVNAYWLGIASSYSYARRDALAATAATLRSRWGGQVEYFSNDADAALAHHSQAMWVDLPDVAILAFRGTQQSVQDWATDFRFLAYAVDAAHPEYGNIHVGFRDGLDVIWPEVKAKLLSLRGTNKPLFITGHSLGGALAVVTVSRMLAQPEFAPVMQNNLHGLYTYGAPRVGDEGFARYFRDKATSYPAFHIARVRNYLDVISRIPSSRVFFPYEHIGPLFYFDAPGRLYSSTSNVAFRGLFMPHDVAANMVENYADYQGSGFVSKYTDHSMANGYLKKMDAEYGRSLAWTTANRRDACDMGMYAVAWAQNPRPPEAKPYTNNLPLASAHVESGQTVKDCCWCYRTWYYDKFGWDKAFKQENFVGVIQEGEIASGNCMYPGGKPQGHVFRQGQARDAGGTLHDQYYTYSSCEGVKLKGDRCIAGEEIFKDGRGTGRVIAPNSWTP
jgi:triacylglycerol lipase